MSEIPFSPFTIEYALMERHPKKPDQWKEIMLTTDRDIAYGALAGLNMQFGMRARWADTELPPNQHGVGRFQVLARLQGSKWLHPDEVYGFVQTITIALGEYDSRRGYPSGVRGFRPTEKKDFPGTEKTGFTDLSLPPMADRSADEPDPGK